jgi:hypothetical protein
MVLEHLSFLVEHHNWVCRLDEYQVVQDLDWLDDLSASAETICSIVLLFGTEKMYVSSFGCFFDLKVSKFTFIDSKHLSLGKGNYTDIH